jgi:hypothetical protein
MDWKQLLAYISGSVDEELLLRIEYLVAENRILRDQIKGRIQLTDAQRKTLTKIGKKLSKQALEEVANSVKPDTILAWQLSGLPRHYRYRWREARALAIPISQFKCVCREMGEIGQIRGVLEADSVW